MEGVHLLKKLTCLLGPKINVESGTRSTVRPKRPGNLVSLFWDVCLVGVFAPTKTRGFLKMTASCHNLIPTVFNFLTNLDRFSVWFFNPGGS